MRFLEFFSYFVVTLALGWWYVRTSPNWSMATKIAFCAIVVVIMFVGHHLYRLSTGENFEDSLANALLCPVYELPHCRDDEAEAKAEAERVRVEALTKQHRLAAEAEAERRQAEAEARAAEAELKRLEAEARAAEAEKKRKEAEEKAAAAARPSQPNRTYIPRSESNNPRPPAPVYAATVVGKVAHRQVRGFSSVNQWSKDEARSKALADCNRSAFDCRVLVAFGGPGRCAYLSDGTIHWIESDGRTGTSKRVHWGKTESEAMYKCQADQADGCQIFHRGCNR